MVDLDLRILVLDNWRMLRLQEHVHWIKLTIFSILSLSHSLTRAISSFRGNDDMGER